MKRRSTLQWAHFVIVWLCMLTLLVAVVISYTNAP